MALRTFFSAASTGFPLRHAAGELRHVSNVAVVFGVENQVHKKLSGLSHARILQQRGRHEPK